MRTHLTLTYFLSPSISKIIFIAFISFNFAPCFTQDTLHEFKACGVKNYYNGRALANISYPKIGRRPKLDYTIGMNSLEYNVLKINQSDHRVTIMKEDHFDHFSALNKMETATLDYHMFMYSSNDRNISVWYDCPQEDINWEDYSFPCGSKQGKQGRSSYVFETSGQIGGCKMKMEVAVTINGSEGGMNKTRPALVVEKGRRRWFSFGYKNLYVIQGLEGRKNGMTLLEKAGRLEFTVPYVEQTNQDRKGGRKNLMNSLEKATRRRFNNIFHRLQAMEGLKEGGKNKLGVQEKAIWFDFIYKKTRNYRRDEIEGLKLEGRKNRMSLLEKPENRTKQELEVEYKNLYTIACDACREAHGKCGENATYQFYCICETQDQHRPYICIASPRPGKSNLLKKIFIIVAIASGSIILTISTIIFIYSTRKHISRKLRK